MNKKIKQILPIAIFLILVSIGIIYLIQASNKKDDKLLASGTIESTEVTLSSEFSGLVYEVKVEEGERVKAGQVLVRFDEKYIKAQLQQAEATLSQSKAAYDQAVAIAKLEKLSAQKVLDDLFDNVDIARAQAEQAVITAQDNLALAQNIGLERSQAELAYTEAQERLDDLKKERENLNYNRCKTSTTDSAYADYLLAKDTYDNLKEDYDSNFSWKAEDDISRATALSKLSAAKEVFDRAQSNLTYCQEKVGDIDISKKDAEIHLAEAQLIETQQKWDSYNDDIGIVNKNDAKIDLAQAELDKAMRELEKLKDGPDPDAIAIAQARLDSSETGIAVAQAQVEVAEAALAALQVQFDKRVIKAPADGTVLARTIQPGEIISAGVPLIILGELSDLTIVVYLPEDRYGAVHLGNQVNVVVDSFPGETFSAIVTQISGEAEFTPRNVQTGEGRRSTVFAITLSIKNENDQLKPGMPADVYFE